MRLALPGSALVHAGAVSLLVFGLSWPQPEDAAAPAPVTVTVVPLSTVASNASAVVEASDAVSSRSAGGPETVEAQPEPLDSLTPEPVAPLAQAALEPVAPAPLAPQTIEPLAPEPVPSLVAALSSTAASVVETAPAPSLAPLDTPTETTPPVMPRPLSQRPPSRTPPREAPRQTPAQTPPKAAAATAGNGGDSQADATASAGGAPPRAANSGSGGSAEVARYPSQVINRLKRAMRHGGARGELVVRFTVTASGALKSVSIARSSGKPDLDAAGQALVERAAPFPPIPTGADRSSWTFDVPLAFGG